MSVVISLVISNKYHQIVSTKDLEIHCFKVVILEKKSHHSWLNRKTFFFHSKWRLREENCDFQSKSIIWERNNEFILRRWWLEIKKQSPESKKKIRNIAHKPTFGLENIYFHLLGALPHLIYIHSDNSMFCQLSKAQTIYFLSLAPPLESPTFAVSTNAGHCPHFATIWMCWSICNS